MNVNIDVNRLAIQPGKTGRLCAPKRSFRRTAPGLKSLRNSTSGLSEASRRRRGFDLGAIRAGRRAQTVCRDKG